MSISLQSGPGQKKSPTPLQFKEYGTIAGYEEYTIVFDRNVSRVSHIGQKKTTPFFVDLKRIWLHCQIKETTTLSFPGCAMCPSGTFISAEGERIIKHPRSPVKYF